MMAPLVSSSTKKDAVEGGIHIFKSSVETSLITRRTEVIWTIANNSPANSIPATKIRIITGRLDLKELIHPLSAGFLSAP